MGDKMFFYWTFTVIPCDKIKNDKKIKITQDDEMEKWLILDLLFVILQPKK